MNGQKILDLARIDRRNLFDLERLKEGMKRSNLDAVVAVSPENVTYTGGAYVQIPILSSFVVTTASGSQGVVINEADAYFFRENSWIKDIRSFRYTANSTEANRNAVGLLAELLGDLDVDSARIGIEATFFPWTFAEETRRQVPKAKWEDAGDAFNYARLVKTPDEIALFRFAAYYTDKAIMTAFADARPGDTEKGLAAEMQAKVLRFGADQLSHAHVHSGIHSTVVHALSIEKPLEPGEVVHVDFGASFAGYNTDISRNAVVQEASSKQEEIYSKLWHIEEVLFDYVRPGVLGNDVFELSEKEFKKVGLVYPWGTIGHSTGLSVHEGFELARGSEGVVEEGMIFQIEPSHIEAGDARYHIEDSVLIVSDGVELLTEFGNKPEMFVIR